MILVLEKNLTKRVQFGKQRDNILVRCKFKIFEEYFCRDVENLQQLRVNCWVQGDT
jgi:hypothetical protein